MSQRPASRIDRFAQMSKQEELIAKKRQEILEKQRTAELAKAVAAAQTLAAKLKTAVNEEAEKKSSDNSADEDVKSEATEVAVQGSTTPAAAAVVVAAATTTTSSAKGSSSTLSSLTGKTGKMFGGSGQKRPTMAAPSAEQPQVKIQNTFCNDGSFLENFKKILEKQQQQPKPFIAV